MSTIGYATLSVIPSMRDGLGKFSGEVESEMASTGKRGGVALAKAAAVGMTALAAGAVGAGKALYEIGSTFDDVSDTIRVGTGATGKALEDLNQSAKNIGTEVPASFEDIGTTVADLNTRLGLTGPTLETLSKQFLEAGRITGQALDVNTVTASFSAFSIQGKDTSAALDDLYRVSQATGVGINELAASVAKGAPQFQQFGFSFRDSAALLGTLDKAGLNSQATIMALSRGMIKFAKDGKEPKKALRETVSAIEKFTKKGKDAEAIKLAASIFGTKGAGQFVQAVKTGKVNLDDLMKSTGATSDTILGAAADTADFSEKLQVFKNKILVGLEPIATRVFNAIGNAMDWISSTGAPAVQKFAGEIGNRLAPVMKTARGVFDSVVAAVKNLIAEWQNGEGAGGKIRAVFENVVSVGKSMGGVFVEIGKKVVDFIKGFVKDFQDGEGAGGKFKDALSKVGEVIQNVTKWLSEHETLVKSVTVAVLAGVGAYKTIKTTMAIVTAATRAYAIAQGILNVVMNANPIGVIVVALAALAAGLIYAYQNSETFRSYVSTAFSMVKIGALAMAKIVVSGFQFIANIWMTVVGALLDGAAAAFGWVPGIGPKLQGAATEFGKFRDSANAKLDAINNEIDIKISTEQANIALEELHREFLSKGWTITPEVDTNRVYIGGGMTKAVPRATGGQVAAGGMYAVGDNRDGSWNKTTELFVPDRSGRILTQAQIRQQLKSATRAQGQPAGPVTLSRRSINDLADAMARRPAGRIGINQLDQAMGGSV